MAIRFIRSGGAEVSSAPPSSSIKVSPSNPAAVFTPTSTPRRLTIYYGIPSLVNGAAGDIARAVEVFAEYDVAVFGDGLEFDDVQPRRTPAGAGPVEHQRTRGIIARLAAHAAPHRGLRLRQARAAPTALAPRDPVAHRPLGRDGRGRDPVRRGRRRFRRRPRASERRRGCGARGRAARRLNASNPDDVFRTGVDRVRPRLGAGDAYLLEAFAVRAGRIEDPRLWRERVHKAWTGATATGAALWATTTTQEDYDASLMEHAWHAAKQAGVDAFGWGEPFFAGPDSRLPFRPRPR